MSKKMTKRQRIKEVKQEIEWYNPKKRIADFMFELVELGFEFCGHGCGCGGEDFSMFIPDKLHVNICDQGRKVAVMISDITDDDDQCVLFEGTIGKALKYFQGLHGLK